MIKDLESFYKVKQCQQCPVRILQNNLDKNSITADLLKTISISFIAGSLIFKGLITICC